MRVATRSMQHSRVWWCLVPALLAVQSWCADAATRTWSGAGSNDNWTTAANWGGGVAPVASDSLIFPDSALRKTNNNDFPADTSFNLLTMTGGAFHLQGHAIKLVGGISANMPSTSVIHFDITLTAAQSFVNDGTGGVLLFVGAVNLNGNSLEVSGARNVNFAGKISGTGSVTKNGTSTLFFQGTNNDYAGPTQVNSGILETSLISFLGATGAGNGTTVADGGTLRLSGNTSLSEGVALAGAGSSAFGALAASGCIPGCSLNGPITLSADSAVGVGMAGDTLTLGAVGQIGAARALTKVGPGTVVLSGVNTYSKGTTVQAGTLRVTGSVAIGLVTLAGGTLSGTGTVAAISGSGTVAPGNSAGILHATGAVTFGAATTLAVELAGTTLGTQYDQLNTTGTVNLGGALLNIGVINGFVPAVGDQFTIIQSTGAISGQFAQGTSVTNSTGSVQFIVSYHANSVVLTVVSRSTGALNVDLLGSGFGTVTSQDGLINCGAACAHTYVGGTIVTLTATPLAGSKFTGWLGRCTGFDQCVATLGAATNEVSATFAPLSIGTRVLDADGNNHYDALSDGLLILRHLFGLAGPSLVAGALGNGASRMDPAVIASYLTDVRPLLDVDGNGNVDALTDGLLILRRLFGLTGSSLIQGAIGGGAIRITSPLIEDYLNGLMPQ